MKSKKRGNRFERIVAMTATDFRRFVMVPLLSVALSAAGCLESEIQENSRQLEAQRAEIERLEHDVAMLRQQQAANAPVSPPPTCDREVARKATDLGTQKFAAKEFDRSLGYYRDALSACSDDGLAEFNVARAYEALGDRRQALTHYERAIAPGSSSDAETVRRAKAALFRLRPSD
jgi:tetratricopeptide (TPR) repeat protein